MSAMRSIGQLPGIISLTLLLVGTAAAEPMLREAFDHDGIEREYFVHIPNNATGELPVVVALHGYTSTATGFQVAHDLNFHADKHGFIVVYAQGSHFPVDNGQDGFFRITTWNAFGDAKPDPGAGPQCAADAYKYPCPPECGECGRCAWASCYDDIAYIEKLLDGVEANFEVDKQRIYALGVSAGGIMLLRLGCDLSDRFAAIAPIIAFPPSGYACGPATDLPMLLLYGAEDETIRFDGRAGKDDGFIYTTAVDTTRMWAESLQCESGPDVWQNEFSAAAGLECVAYSSCRSDGAEVVSCMDPDGDHRWPEQRPDSLTATCVTVEQYASMPAQQHCEPRAEDGIHLGMDLVWNFFGRYRSADR